MQIDTAKWTIADIHSRRLADKKAQFHCRDINTEEWLIVVAVDDIRQAMYDMMMER